MAAVSRPPVKYKMMEEDGAASNTTGLHFAAWFGLEEEAKALLLAGVETDPINADGYTPLMWAAHNGNESVVKLLLDTNKVDLGVKDIPKRTPLALAIVSNHRATAELLLEKSTAEEVDSNLQTGWMHSCQVVTWADMMD